MPAACIVYVVGSQRNPVKIGVCNDLTSRLMGLQTGNPDTLHVWHALPVPGYLGLDTERAAHAILADRRRAREWFDVDADEAFAAVKQGYKEAARNMQGRCRGRDIIEDLGHSYVLSPWARDAAVYYQEQLAYGAIGRPKVEAMNAAVYAATGMAGLQVLQIALSTGTIRGHTTNRQVQRAATAALADAINALAGYYDGIRADLLAAAIAA